MADLNSMKPTSAISFLASFTRFSIVANGSLKTTLTLLSFAVADRYVSLIILATSSAESSVAGKLAFRHKSRIFSPVSKKFVLAGVFGILHLIGLILPHIRFLDLSTCYSQEHYLLGQDTSFLEFLCIVRFQM